MTGQAGGEVEMLIVMADTLRDEAVKSGTSNTYALNTAVANYDGVRSGVPTGGLRRLRRLIEDLKECEEISPDAQHDPEHTWIGVDAPLRSLLLAELDALFLAPHSEAGRAWDGTKE